MRIFIQLLDLLFLVEIVLNFFTAFKDTETFEPVYTVKKIAINYILNGSFFVHILAAFPYELFTNPTFINDGSSEDTLRNLIILKMFRLSRLSTDFIPDDVLL